jgi:uncharacterized repeat protein (TIGR03803 family)
MTFKPFFVPGLFIATVVLLLLTVMHAQTLTTLLSFDAKDGAHPISPPVQGPDGEFYGTTSDRGANFYGNVYKVNSNGTIVTLHDFCAVYPCADGAAPFAPLLLGTDGNFYGTTVEGGAFNGGTVFRITPAGQLTTLYNFCAQSNCDDGASPRTSLIQGIDGNFYGTTLWGGGSNNYGTIFRISPKGDYTTLYKFCQVTGCLDGENPGILIQGTDGNFYGTASFGGANGNYGTLFRLTLAGKLSVLHSFCAWSSCEDGIYPYGLVQADDGNFYGTAVGGGVCPYSAGGCGTIFKMTPAGKLTKLYNFCSQNNCPDGMNPLGLMQGSDSNFYGTSAETIFRVTSLGKFTTLYTFCSENYCADGSLPEGLVQATAGTFFGATQSGGTPGVCECGTVYRFADGLKPFVRTVPSARKVGAPVVILGNNLLGSTSVTFGATAATFTVVSASEIRATLPTGAASGKVNVVTPHGALSTPVAFRVTPQNQSFAPASGPVGTSITITGMSLAQTIRVTFGGVAASNFSVDSDIQVSVVVPVGAKTGKIAVTTDGGTATSSGTFTVTP